MNEIEQIKQRVDIVELVKEYVPLKQAGANWKALSPFTNEKTPSFIVSPEKQIWHCFSSGQGGDVFTFLQKIEGLEFPEALRKLASRAGIKLTYHRPEEHNRRTRLIDALQTAADFWQDKLWQTEGKKALIYLQGRGLVDETIKDFGIGYSSSSWDKLTKHLLTKKFSLKELADAGLIISKDSKVYDRFRNRIMYPIMDLHGSLAGFGGRTISTGKEVAKYVNSPQTDIYNKSAILYNFNLAKQKIRQLDYVILVEGYMDVIACWQAGTKNVVSVSGTALTPDQIKLIKRFTNNVMIAFDADTAGVKANLRGIDLAWQAGLNVKVVNLPEGEDPDTLVKKNIELWRKLLKEAQSYMDYAFEATIKQFDLSRIDHKKQAARALLLLVKNLGDPVERSFYLSKAADILEVKTSVLEEVLASISKQKPAVKTQPAKIAPPVNVEFLRYQNLIALLFSEPDLIKKINLPSQAIKDILYRSLYEKFKLFYNKTDKFKIEEFFNQFEAKEKLLADGLKLLADGQYSTLTTVERQKELDLLTAVINKSYIKQQQEELLKQIKLAEKAGNKEKFQALLNQKIELDHALKD